MTNWANHAILSVITVTYWLNSNPMKHMCPKCGRMLQQSGEADCDGETYAVFQCDECISYWELEGEKIEIALTFGVKADGTIIDPDAPHKPIKFD